MHQVVQNVRNGQLNVTHVPEPSSDRLHPDSECLQRHLSRLPKKWSSIGCQVPHRQSRARPDQVRQIIDKMRTQGVFNTIQQSLKNSTSQSDWVFLRRLRPRLWRGVQNFKPGDRVASNGPHAGVVCISKHLCAQVPSEVPFEHAAFTVMGSIALQGVRLAKLGLADTVLVIGLGLVDKSPLSSSKPKAAGSSAPISIPPSANLPWKWEPIAPPGNWPTEVSQLYPRYRADAVLITRCHQIRRPH